MTNYYLEVGYNQDESQEYCMEKLIAAVKELREQPEKILNELKDNGSHKVIGSNKDLLEYAEQYSDKVDDLTLVLKDLGNTVVVTQTASGGGMSRLIKEEMRRAFCRLVINKMHKDGINVNLNVI